MKVLIILMVIGAFLVSGCEVKKVEDLKDSDLFAKEFNIDKENNFEYATYEEIINVLKGETGIVLFASADDDWCLKMVEILNDSTKDKDFEGNIYYYDPTSIKKENSDEYKELLKILDGYLEEDKKGNKNLLIPDIYFVKEGKIIGHNNKLIDLEHDPGEYFTDEKIEEIKKCFNNFINDYNVKECKTN